MDEKIHTFKNDSHNLHFPIKESTLRDLSFVINKLPHTLNNTVVAPPRMLIAFLENNLNEDGSVNIPQPLRMYMGGKEKLIPAEK